MTDASGPERPDDRERRLAVAAARGDQDALGSLYKLYAEELFTVAYHFTHCDEDARDVLHDLFVSLPRVLRSYDPKRPLRPWLRRVTANVALAKIRGEKHRREVHLPPQLVGEDGPEEPILNSVTLASLLSQLSDNLREVVVLKELIGHTHDEIARILGIQSSTSRGRLQRARLALFKARDGLQAEDRNALG